MFISFNHDTDATVVRTRNQNSHSFFSIPIRSLPTINDATVVCGKLILTFTMNTMWMGWDEMMRKICENEKWKQFFFFSMARMWKANIQVETSWMDEKHDISAQMKEKRRLKHSSHDHMSYFACRAGDDSLISTGSIRWQSQTSSTTLRELNWSQSMTSWAMPHQKSVDEMRKFFEIRSKKAAAVERRDIYVALVFRWRLTYFKYILWLLVTQTFAMSSVKSEKIFMY